MMREPYDLDYSRPREGAMLRRQLQTMVEDASSLRSALHPDDNVPAWTQSKIATAQDRLHVASRYLRNRITDYGMPYPRIGSDPLDALKPYLVPLSVIGLIGLVLLANQSPSGARSPKRRKSRATRGR